MADSESLLGDVGAQFLESVEFGCLDREIVVELGQLLLADLLDRDCENGVLSGEFGGAVLLRESHFDLDLVAGGGADDLLFEVVDQLAGSDLDHVVGRGAAFELDVVEAADEIDQHVVTVCGGTLDRVEAGHSLTQPLNLAVDYFVGHVRLRAFRLRGRGTHRARLPGGLRPRT